MSKISEEIVSTFSREEWLWLPVQTTLRPGQRTQRSWDSWTGHWNQLQRHKTPVLHFLEGWALAWALDPRFGGIADKRVYAVDQWNAKCSWRLRFRFVESSGWGFLVCCGWHRTHQLVSVLHVVICMVRTFVMSKKYWGEKKNTNFYAIFYAIFSQYAFFFLVWPTTTKKGLNSGIGWCCEWIGKKIRATFFLCCADVS